MDGGERRREGARGCCWGEACGGGSVEADFSAAVVGSKGRRGRAWGGWWPVRMGRRARGFDRVEAQEGGGVGRVWRAIGRV